MVSIPLTASLEQADRFVLQNAQWIRDTRVKNITKLNRDNADLPDKATKVLLKELGLSTSDLGTQKAKDVISNCDTKQLMQDTGLDSYTLKDILDAICLPLRDYRDKYDAPLLRKDVLEIEDLHINDKLEGTVRNVVDFGAFVDIGLHEDGLVHISKMSSNRVKHPSDVVSVGDIVTVWVYNIDQEKQKVQLTMVNPN